MCLPRPLSSKNKSNGFWGQSNKEEQEQSYSKHPKTKKKVKLIRPDLTTNDFSCIMPRKMYKDKERLYSEGLQLKQAFNQVSAENTRLKTQISMMQKQKYRVSRLTEMGEGSKLNNKHNEFPRKSNDKEQPVLRGYKRLIRDLKDQKLHLQSQNKKIKKTVKYIKINQLQIELKIVIEENKKLAELIQDYQQRLNQTERLEVDNEELQTALEKQYQNNKKLGEENQRLNEEMEELESEFKGEMERWKNKENKLIREVNLHKKKALQNQKHSEDLKRELKSIMEAKESNNKKRSSKSAHKSMGPAVNIHNPQGQVSRLSDFEKDKSYSDKLSYQKQIEELKKELEHVRGELTTEKEKNKEKTQTLEQFSDSKIHLNKLHLSQSKKSPQAQSDINIEADYDQEFESGEELKVSRKEQQQEEELRKIKEEFSIKTEEESLYKKEEDSLNKKEDKKQTKKKGSKSNLKKSKERNSPFKPQKAILTQIKELLTYRMKSQRYPFSDLKADIQAAEEPSFKYFELMQMMSNEPFYLKKDYAEAFLHYCFQKKDIQATEKLQNKVLIQKLRKVVVDFDIMPQEKEKEMIIRIAEMTSSYPQELQLAFENIKNGEQTVSKANLQKMFKKLELEDDYIDLIISELSLCSDDLEHLNFVGFFERFYIGDDDYEEDAIEEEREQSEESHVNSSRVNSKKNRESKKSNL